MNLTLHVWRQDGPLRRGASRPTRPPTSRRSMSFLDMLDLVNDEITRDGGEPIAFEHDCREGICGSCGMMINGVAHGPHKLTTACQLHMRSFKDGDEIWIEPWRARPFR
jgi:succinate dehydrogenase / fumarate reductase, iron-sulfur subunit